MRPDREQAREIVSKLVENDPEFSARLKETCASLEAQNAKFAALQARLANLRKGTGQ